MTSAIFLLEPVFLLERGNVGGMGVPVGLDRRIDRIGRGSGGLGGGRDRQRGGGATGGNGQEVPPRPVDERDSVRVCGGVLCTLSALAMEGLRWLGLEPGRKFQLLLGSHLR